MSREPFKCGISFSVGDGNRTSFWSDNWIGGMTLRTQFFGVFNVVQSNFCRVNDCYGPNGWRWRKILSGYAASSSAQTETIRNLKALLADLHPTNSRDVIRWRWTSSEAYSVKSMYKFLQDSGVIDKSFVQLWKSKIPLKVKIFVWLVLKRRVLTTDNLLKRG